MLLALRPNASHHAHAGAQHIHRMRARRQQFQRLFYFLGQPAQPYQSLLVRREFARVGQPAMDQQVRHFLKLAMRGKVDNVEPAIVQVIAGVAHGAQRGLPGGRTGKGHGLLGFEGGRGRSGFAHGDLQRASS